MSAPAPVRPGIGVDPLATSHSRAAAHFFLWRRYSTKLGLVTLGSLLICLAAAFFAYEFGGTDWFFGFVCTILGLNIIMLSTAHAALPRAMAKSVSKLSDPQAKVATNSEGFSISLAGNTVRQDWSRVRYLWVTDRFVVLGNSFFRVLHIPTKGMTAEVRAAFSQHVHH